MKLMKNELLERIGKNLKMFRRALNLKQKDVAESLGVEVPTVSRWETGVMAPSGHHMNALCKLYNIQERQLWDLQNDGSHTPPEFPFEMIEAIKDAVTVAIAETPKITRHPTRGDAIEMLLAMSEEEFETVERMLKNLNEKRIALKSIPETVDESSSMERLKSFNSPEVFDRLNFVLTENPRLVLVPLMLQHLVPEDRDETVPTSSDGTSVRSKRESVQTSRKSRKHGT